VVGKKIANGAFGQLREARDLHRSSNGNHVCNGGSFGVKLQEYHDDLVAIKFEHSAAKIPMLGLE